MLCAKQEFINFSSRYEVAFLQVDFQLLLHVLPENMQFLLRKNSIHKQFLHQWKQVFQLPGQTMQCYHGRFIITTAVKVSTIKIYILIDLVSRLF